MPGGYGDDGAESAPQASTEPEFDPSPYVPEGQEIVFQGWLFKFETDMDPSSQDAWLRRKVWLTSGGGIFYWSQKHGKALGRPISGMSVSEASISAKTYAFELSIPAKKDVPVTVLAAATAEERDEWMKKLKEFDIEAAVESQSQDGNCASSQEDAKSQPNPNLLFPASMEAFGLRTASRGRSASGCPSERSQVRPVSSRGGLEVRPVSSRGLNISTTSTGDAKEGLQVRPVLSKGGNVFSASTGQEGKERDAQDLFAQPRNTVLVLDWDDTIFPTTWIREDVALDWRVSVDEQLPPGARMDLIKALLSKHEQKAVQFMTQACRLASKVIIVTLARRPWVHTCKNFSPELDRVIDMHKVKVIYAQESASDSELVECNSQDDFQSEEQACEFWTRVKELAIAREIDEYHKRIGASWKNILSIGDSNYERYGTQSAGEQYMKKEMEDGGEIVTMGATSEGISKAGERVKLRVKTLKLLSEPTVEEITAELALLSSWLPFMVTAEDGFDVELETTEDDEALNEMHYFFTGEDKHDLSWAALAGMET